jgi:hypothetical protein
MICLLSLNSASESKYVCSLLFLFRLAIYEYGMQNTLTLPKDKNSRILNCKIISGFRFCRYELCLLCVYMKFKTLQPYRRLEQTEMCKP